VSDFRISEQQIRALASQESLTDEEVEDIVGAMVGRGLAYDDGAGVIAQTRRGPNPYDAAETWDESTLQLSVDGVVVKNLSLALMGEGGYEFTQTFYGSNTDATCGMLVTPNQDIAGIKGKIAADQADFQNARITRDSDGTVITSIDATGLGPGDTVQFDGVTLNSGTTYRIEITPDSSQTPRFSYVGDSDWNTSWPVGPSQFDIDGPSNNPVGYDTPCVWDDLSTIPATSGTSYVRWDAPEAISEWDVATFEAHEDGGSIDVYVEHDDGTGWTSIGPISPNYDMSEIAASDDVRLRAELSRPSLSENPTVNAAYLSWFV